MVSGFRGQQQDDSEASFSEKVVHVRRVAKVVKGGCHMSFNALVVVGDGHGRVGVALGRGPAVPDAVQNGNKTAKKLLITVSMRGNTVPHSVTTKYGATTVLLKPASAGAGVKAGGAVPSGVVPAGSGGKSM